MHRLAKISLGTIIACITTLLLGLTIYFGQSFYRDTSYRLAVLENRVNELKSAPFPPIHVREGEFRINTSDKQIEKSALEYQLPFGPDAEQSFEDYVWKEPGHVVNAWVMDWSPRSEMSKFEEFKVVPVLGTAKFTIKAKPYSNVSVDMKFHVAFICQ